MKKICLLLMLFIFMTILNTKSQNNEILLGIEYNMPIGKSSDIIDSQDEPVFTELGGYKLKLGSVLKSKKLTKGVVFYPDVNMKESIINDVILGKSMDSNDITQVFNLMKDDLITKGYKIIYNSPVVGIMGSYVIAQKDEKIIGLIYSHIYNENSYKTYYDYRVYFTNSEILNNDKDFFRFFRVKNIQNENVETNIF